MVGFLRLAPFARLAFVPSGNFPDPAALPAPSTHIFYHRRINDAHDTLPKSSGYWPSEIAVTKAILGSILHRADDA